MSVATQIKNYNDGLLAAYNAVQTKGGTVPVSKNMINLPTAIDSIQAGGDGQPILVWGGKNPELIETKTLSINIADDTSYSSITPTTSSQTIFTASQSSYQQQSVAIDLANYDYVIVMDMLLPHEYTQTPTTNHTTCQASKGTYYITKRISSGTTRVTNMVYNGTSVSVGRYIVNGNTPNFGTNISYALGIGSSAPSLSSNSSNTPYIYYNNPSITVRTQASYMAQDSWQYLDASSTSLEVKWQLFRVDKDSLGGIESEMAKDMAIDETMKDNMIKWYSESGGGSNIVAKPSVTKITNKTSYQNTAAEITIPSTGTWKLSWYCYTSSSTSSSTKAKLFKNGTTEVGSSHQAKAYSSSTPEICEETLSLNAGDTIMVKGCTKSGSSYYIYIVNLIAEKQ